MKGFGIRLKEARGAESQASFAKRLGISQVGYSRYESDQREPDLETLYQIGMLTGVSADWLLGLPERDGTSTAIANGGVAITGSGNKIRGTIVASGDHGHDKCSECKFKKFAEAFKAIQSPA